MPVVGRAVSRSTDVLNIWLFIMRMPQLFAVPADVISFAEGDTIFRKGDEAGQMFVVESGMVDILIDGNVVETIGPDGFFGEMSLIDDSPRSADAMARTDCRLATLNRRRFLFMVEEVPLFVLHVMKGMADRLRRAPQALTTGAER